MSAQRDGRPPFEVNDGRVLDVYKMKFRKSELGRTAGNKMRHTASEVCRQLDHWKKEQKVKMGKLNKRQYQMYETRRRLKREQRRIKVNEYMKQQEEIRRQLKDVRERELMLEVLQKFKENAYMSKEERRAEIERMTKEALQQEKEPEEHSSSSSNEVPATSNETSATSHPAPVNIHMETIQEELEVEDKTQQTPLPQSRATLDRSVSQRDIFVAKEKVPLLPELSRSNISTVIISGLSDRDDKGTQTPVANEESGRGRKCGDRCKVRKNILVKLPRSSRTVAKSNRSPSAQRIYGSDTVDCDYEADDDISEDTLSDDGFPEGEYWESYSDYSNQSSSSSVESLTDRLNFPISKLNISPRQYCPSDYTALVEGYGFLPKSHTSLPKDFSSISKEYGFIQREYDSFQKEHPLIRKVYEPYPEKEFVAKPHQFPKQNPYSLQFKERSFFITPPADDSNRRTGSACDKSHHQEGSNSRDVGKSHREQFLDIRDKMTRQYSLMNSDRDARHMTIYGRKADYNNKKHTTAPPNTPLVNSSHSNLINRSHLSAMLLNQKRAEIKDKKRHNILSLKKVSVINHERSESSYLPTSGSPRVHSASLGSPGVMDYDVFATTNRYGRERLLRAEQNAILRQNTKIKKFVESFSPEYRRVPHPPQPYSAAAGVDPQHPFPVQPRPTFGSFLIRILQLHQPQIDAEKIVPSTSGTTSGRLLRKCRYRCLQEYIPRSNVPTWKLRTMSTYQTTRQQYYTPCHGAHVDYIANVRI